MPPLMPQLMVINIGVILLFNPWKSREDFETKIYIKAYKQHIITHISHSTPIPLLAKEFKYKEFACSTLNLNRSYKL
jgi:hypothetical protein